LYFKEIVSKVNSEFGKLIAKDGTTHVESVI
jgi:hypothetical protein